MTEIDVGYALSSEEHPPNDLVDYARRAEEVGFDFASISDHYHPWLESQGHSPFVWSTLGGIAEATESITVGTGVTCPIMRIHPAILAQAAATAATMLPGRFFFGVGTGERLNEHVVGDYWPPHHVRLDMLEEAVSIIRELWLGGMHSRDGYYYTVENARVFTLPEEPPPIYVSAYGPKTAKAAAEMGDGLVTVGPEQNVARTYADAGGDGPRIAQLTVCWAESEDEAVETAHEWWRNSILPGELPTELPTPTHFEQATKMVTKRDVREAKSIVTNPDAQKHVDEIEKFADAGYDHVYVHQVGPNQEGFFRFYEDEILPEFR